MTLDRFHNNLETFGWFIVTLRHKKLQNIHLLTLSLIIWVDTVVTALSHVRFSRQWIIDREVFPLPNIHL